MSLASFALDIDNLNKGAFPRAIRTEPAQTHPIIGSSFKFRQVLKQVETVAPTSICRVGSDLI